jgi:hypothetical protein
MSGAKASFLVCDDLLYSLTGKVNLVGIYAQDIVIPADELLMQQLIFFFVLEMPKDKVFKKISFRIELPQSDPLDFPIPVLVRKSSEVDERRKMLAWRHPVLVQQPILRLGRISASVVHEGRRLDAGGIWVTSIAEAQAAAALDNS